MLAASLPSSNVPPDNLQAAPVGARSAVPGQQFAEDYAAMVPQANPADSAKQHATRLPLCRTPYPVCPQDRYMPFGCEAQHTASGPAAPEQPQFAGTCRGPQDTGGEAQPQVGRELQDNHKTCNAEQQAGGGNDPAKSGIRLEFGGVCG